MLEAAKVVAKTAEPYRAVFSPLGQHVAPGDEIAARFWGNIPAGCRQAAQTITEAASGMAIS